jgi:hypothetical protein
MDEMTVAEFARVNGITIEQARAFMAENAAALRPTTTQVGQTEEGFFTDSTPINAYYLDPSAAGSQSQFQTAGFYDNLRQAQQQGQNIYGQQQGLADILLARSQGRGGPSLAQLQLQQSLEQNKRDAAGQLAAAGRTINPALAQRLLLNQQSQLQGKTAGDAAMLRAKEQLDAQAAYANQLANMRNSETSMYGTSGQLGLGQEKLAVDVQEDQKRRVLEVARANQEAAKAASGQAATTDIANQRATNELVTEVAKGAGTAINQASPPGTPPVPPVPAYNGGYIKRKNYAKGGMVSTKGQEEETKKDIEDNRKNMAFMKVLKEALGRPKNPYTKDAEYKKFMDNDIERGAIIRKGIEESRNVRAGKPYASREEIDARAQRLMNNTPNEEDQSKSKAFRAERDLLDMEYRVRAAENDAQRVKREGDTRRQPVRGVGPIDLPSAPGRLDPADIKNDMFDARMGIERSRYADGGKINAAMGKLTKMDNEKNDTVPAMLSPGEIVLPRSIVSSPNAPVAAAKFVEALLANRDKKDAKKVALMAALGRK